jgi:hypothetical protein
MKPQFRIEMGISVGATGDARAWADPGSLIAAVAFGPDAPRRADALFGRLANPPEAESGESLSAYPNQVVRVARVLETTHREIWRDRVGPGSPRGLGVGIAVLADEKVYFLQVGSARLYLLRGETVRPVVDGVDQGPLLGGDAKSGIHVHTAGIEGGDRLIMISGDLRTEVPPEVLNASFGGATDVQQACESVRLRIAGGEEFGAVVTVRALPIAAVARNDAWSFQDDVLQELSDYVTDLQTSDAPAQAPRVAEPEAVSATPDTPSAEPAEAPAGELDAEPELAEVGACDEDEPWRHRSRSGVTAIAIAVGVIALGLVVLRPELLGLGKLPFVSWFVPSGSPSRNESSGRPPAGAPEFGGPHDTAPPVADDVADGGAAADSAQAPLAAAGTDREDPDAAETAAAAPAEATVTLAGPPGGTVFVDGMATGLRVPGDPVRVAPGPHTLRVDYGKLGVWESTVEVGPTGARVEVALDGWLHLEVPPAAPKGTLTVDSTPVDPRERARKPVSAGEHEVALEWDGVVGWRRSVFVKVGETVTVAVPEVTESEALLALEARRIFPDGFEVSRGDSIWVDRRFVGLTPHEVRLTPGAHSVRIVSSKDRESVTRIVDLAAGTVRVVRADFGLERRLVLRHGPYAAARPGEPYLVPLFVDDRAAPSANEVACYYRRVGEGAFRSVPMMRAQDGGGYWVASLPGTVTAVGQVEYYFVVMDADEAEIVSELYRVALSATGGREVAARPR